MSLTNNPNSPPIVNPIQKESTTGVGDQTEGSYSTSHPEEIVMSTSRERPEKLNDNFVGVGDASKYWEDNPESLVVEIECILLDFRCSINVQADDTLNDLLAKLLNKYPIVRSYFPNTKNYLFVHDSKFVPYETPWNTMHITTMRETDHAGPTSRSFLRLYLLPNPRCTLPALGPSI